MKLNRDIQNIQAACQSLSDESKRLSSVLDDYESLVRKIRKLAATSNSKLSDNILDTLDKFAEL
jgi:hypothetical protein